MPFHGDFDMKLGGLSEHIRQFVTLTLAAFPEWASALEIAGAGDDSDDENCWFCIVPPKCPTHRLYVATRGNSVEVRYDDGKPPGPAEQTFIDLDQSAPAVAEAVVAFVRDVMSGRVVVVRERLGMFARWIRPGCESLAWFRKATELEGRRSWTFAAVYRWEAEHSGVSR